MAEAGLDTVPVVLTGRGTVATAVDAMKRGAFDFIEKDLDIEVLRCAVERAFEHHRLKGYARQMSETAEQWETLFNAVPELITILDKDHRFIRVNKAMAERLGCKPEEVAGKSCYEDAQDLQQRCGRCSHTQLIEESQRQFARMTEERIGGHFLMSASPLRDAQGALIGSVHIARDITEEKKAEEALRKAHAETERLVSSMSSFFVEVDADLRVRRWNIAAERTFGIAARAVLGKPVMECGIPLDWSGVPQDLHAWMASAQPIRLPETRYERSDGSEGILGVTVNPIKNENGESLGFFLQGADISERRTLEAQLLQAQKLESIGQLAAGIAHEINTPTQYVGDNIEFLQLAFEDIEKVRAGYDKLLKTATEDGLYESLMAETAALAEEVDIEYLVEQVPRAIKQSLEGVSRISSIVKAMKEFSYPGAEEKTLTDLNQCIESTITVSRNEWKYVADLEKNLDPMLPFVPCLPGEFNQVILNILVNASHAIAEVIGDASEKKGLITVSTWKNGESAEIRIADTGSGIPEHIRDRIFDPFFTTKGVGRGTGQGLAIAHNVIVEKHNGNLRFETETGKGTTFIIRLPLAGEEHA